MKSFVPKIRPETFCDVFKLCSVRKRGGEYFVGKKTLSGEISEIPFSEVANADFYDGVPIARTYSSGHVFLDETASKVYLLTTKKDEKIQHQFTGGSPLEEPNKEAFEGGGNLVRVRLDMVEENAEIRTFNRTGARVLETYNEIPLVDWALLEGKESDGSGYWKLVCLMHYVVRRYDGVLSHNDGIENVVGG